MEAKLLELGPDFPERRDIELQPHPVAQCPLCDIGMQVLNDLTESAGFGVRHKTAIVREASGSYVVFLETSVATLASVQVALWLMNGCVAQLIELKARLNVVSQKRLPSVIRKRVLLPDQNMPKWMGPAVQSLFAQLFSHAAHLSQVASDLGSKNLQRIEIKRKRRTR